MAHVEKYTSGAAGRMLKHYERAPVEHRGNENIKPELTELKKEGAAVAAPSPYLLVKAPCNRAFTAPPWSFDRQVAVLALYR